MTLNLSLWSPKLGDVNFNSQQAANVGASFGNGAATGNGSNPNNLLQMGDDGNLALSMVSAGSSPSTTGSDRIMAIFTIPAGGFDIANRGVNIMAAGSSPNTNSKTVKVIVNPTAPTLGAAVSGGTTIANTTFTGAGSAAGWNTAVNIFKYGAAGSNTQMCVHESAQCGTVIGTLLGPTNTSFPENAPIVVVITCSAVTAGADIVYNFGQVFAMN